MEPADDLTDYIPEHQRIRKLSADIQEETGLIGMHFLRRPLDSEAEAVTTYIALGTGIIGQGIRFQDKEGNFYRNNKDS